MSENSQPDQMQTFVIPGRTIRGSASDIVLELDREILGLLALRQKLALEALPPRPNRQTRGTRDLLRRLVTVVSIGVLGLSVPGVPATAEAQTAAAPSGIWNTLAFGGRELLCLSNPPSSSSSPSP